MLLINKQLLRLGKNSWGWIIAIVVTKLVVLLSFMVVVSAVSLTPALLPSMEYHQLQLLKP